MRDFRAIAEMLIKRRRECHVRGKVRRALESAYQNGYRDGLADAATEIATNSQELIERVRTLDRDDSDRPAAPQPAPWASH